MEYVKICPMCGFRNPEDQMVCLGEGCDKYIAQAEPVPDEGEGAEEGRQAINDKGKNSRGDSLADQLMEKALQLLEKQSNNMPSEDNKDKALIKNQIHVINNNEINKKQKETVRIFNHTSLCIEYSDKEYCIKPGQVLGRKHPESSAECQIDNMPEFIHRKHCRFFCEDGKWSVTSIKNIEFTNPTYVNSVLVEPGESHSLSNGDHLSLCDVTFRVRIL